MAAKDNTYSGEPDTGINAMIKGMSPLVFIACVALLIIPHLISVGENDPLDEVWNQILNPVTMYAIPLFGIIVSAAFGLPTLRQFLASTSASVFAMIGVLTTSYALGWPYSLIVLFAVIIPGSFWIFKIVGDSGNKSANH